MKTATDKIRAFSQQYIGTQPFFPQQTILRALILNRDLKSAVPETDAFPGDNEEIMVTGYSGSRYWEFIIEPDGTVSYVAENDGDTVDEREGLSFTEALDIISRLKRERLSIEIWKLSESSQANIMIESYKDSQVSPLGLPEGETPPEKSLIPYPVFQLSKQTALKGRFVHTYESTTPTLQGIRSFQ